MRTGVGDEENWSHVLGRASAARREWSRALGRRWRRRGSGRARWEGVSGEEGVVARVGEKRRLRGELVTRVGRDAGDEEGMVACVGKGAGGEKELGLELAKTLQCRRKGLLAWVAHFQTNEFIF